MARAKQRPDQHLIDDDGQRLLRSVLPRQWVLREYRPDYGLDFALEIFQQGAGKETLGEHIFIQLKSTESTESRRLTLYGRGNVEKQRETLRKDDIVGNMETVRFSLETSELLTVERMGIGVPVLLVIADTAKQKCFFVCLNDYIDKILIPRHIDYRTKESRTIHIPVRNDLGDPIVGNSAIRWYGKRAKLLAAFQRIVFQQAELEYAWGEPPPVEMARYFATRLVEYDFWDDTEMCGLIGYYGAAVRRFLASGSPGLMKYDRQTLLRASDGSPQGADELKRQLEVDEIRELWRLLAVLPRNYEDIWREWFLPTPLSFLSSYPPA